jgi:hypothetical protein
MASDAGVRGAAQAAGTPGTVSGSRDSDLSHFSSGDATGHSRHGSRSVSSSLQPVGLVAELDLTVAERADSQGARERANPPPPLSAAAIDAGPSAAPAEFGREGSRMHSAASNPGSPSRPLQRAQRILWVRATDESPVADMTRISSVLSVSSSSGPHSSLLAARGASAWTSAANSRRSSGANGDEDTSSLELLSPSAADPSSPVRFFVSHSLRSRNLGHTSSSPLLGVLGTPAARASSSPVRGPTPQRHAALIAPS